MATELNIEIVTRETIKPSLPTPDNLKTLKLSLLDQFAPVAQTRVLLFFSRTLHDDNPMIINHQRSKLLRQSLSQTLTSFYPFAGRLRGNHSIDCNDAGAEFTETNVNSPLSGVLEKPDPRMLTQLVPTDTVPSEETPLLLVQVNSFRCGGAAVGVSVSHKIADAATISSFLGRWASKAATEPPRLLVSPPLSVSPHGSLASAHPPRQLPPLADRKTAVTRLAFGGSGISALRKKLRRPGDARDPTRVEAVLALVWKCATEASISAAAAGVGPHRRRSSVVYQSVNLRKMLSLEENVSGNYAWSYAAKYDHNKDCEGRESELGSYLAGVIRNGIEAFRSGSDAQIGWEGMSSYVEEYLKLREDGEVDIYMATSWCRFRFYDVDFGWGKPSWVCVPGIRTKNVIVLMDSRDGDGIQVWLSLDEHQMSCFQRNQELLEFASFNPSAMD